MQLSRFLILGLAGLISVWSPGLASEPSLDFARETVEVLDGEGEPLLRASRAYVLDWAGNPDGKVYAVDQASQRVRITPDSTPPLWLSCADLKGTPCGEPKSGTVRAIESLDPTSSASRIVPICPGDPRCPR